MMKPYKSLFNENISEDLDDDYPYHSIAIDAPEIDIKDRIYNFIENWLNENNYEFSENSKNGFNVFDLNEYELMEELEAEFGSNVQNLVSISVENN